MQSARSPRRRRRTVRRQRRRLVTSGRVWGGLYLVRSLAFVVSAVLLVARCLSESTAPPAPPAALGAIPAAMTVAHFRVDAIKNYAKSDFPTQDVYGAIDYARLRLITCGGTFDTATRDYDSNIVVDASSVRS